jgi:hypothetical protein
LATEVIELQSELKYKNNKTNTHFQKKPTDKSYQNPYKKTDETIVKMENLSLEPNYCSHCKKPGHKIKNCYFVKKEKFEVKNSKPTKLAVNEVRKKNDSKEEKDIDTTTGERDGSCFDESLMISRSDRNNNNTKNTFIKNQTDNRIYKEVYLKIKNEKQKLLALIDTGSHINIINKRLVTHELSLEAGAIRQTEAK